MSKLEVSFATVDSLREALRAACYNEAVMQSSGVDGAILLWDALFNLHEDLGLDTRKFVKSLRGGPTGTNLDWTDFLCKRKGIDVIKMSGGDVITSAEPPTMDALDSLQNITLGAGPEGFSPIPSMQTMPTSISEERRKKMENLLQNAGKAR